MTTSVDDFRKLYRGSVAIATLLFFFGFMSGCGSGRHETFEQAFSGETMGTTYHVKVICEKDKTLPKNLGDIIQAAVDEVNAKMSTYRPDSELSRFNQHATAEPFPVSAETAEVFRIALEVCKQSGGMFDITVGPLVNAWGFGPDKEQSPPDDETIAKLRTRVGYQHLEIVPAGLVKKIPDLYCDLSAVAKGYGVDRTALALEHAGITRYMVEVGGEVRAKGKNLSGVPWRIGIERPLPEVEDVQEVVYLSGRSLATSGDYRNFFMKDGKRYSHTIDPTTGKPITHGLASVSVFHESCAWADAYATAITVLGPEAGYEFALAHELPVYMIIHDENAGFTEKSTPAFDKLRAL